MRYYEALKEISQAYNLYKELSLRQVPGYIHTVEKTKKILFQKFRDMSFSGKKIGITHLLGIYIKLVGISPKANIFLFVLYSLFPRILIYKRQKTQILLKIMTLVFLHYVVSIRKPLT